jgi:hypothetical protein
MRAFRYVGRSTALQPDLVWDGLVEPEGILEPLRSRLSPALSKSLV